MGGSQIYWTHNRKKDDVMDRCIIQAVLDNTFDTPIDIDIEIH